MWVHPAKVNIAEIAPENWRFIDYSRYSLAWGPLPLASHQQQASPQRPSQTWFGMRMPGIARLSGCKSSVSKMQKYTYVYVTCIHDIANYTRPKPYSKKWLELQTWSLTSNLALPFIRKTLLQSPTWCLVLVCTGGTKAKASVDQQPRHCCISGKGETKKTSKATIQQTNISHLRERKIIDSKGPWDGIC